MATPKVSKNTAATVTAAAKKAGFTPSVSEAAGATFMAGKTRVAAPPVGSAGVAGPITGAERNSFKESEALALGYTPAYIASRGGINEAGYFNDTPLSGQLSVAEQRSVTNSGGTVNTQAMADILQRKEYNELKASGLDVNTINTRLKEKYGSLYKPVTSTGGSGADLSDPLLPSSGEVNAGGSGTGTMASGGTGVPVKVLGIDVFKQTLGAFFGEAEMSKPWVNELYSSVSRFTKSGSTPDEAFNLAVLDVQKNPTMTEFTKRFKGIYALQEMKQKGQAVTVPTVAEYFATESKMGDILKQSSLGDLANEDFLGDVLAKGVSATEFANRITAIFDRIDMAPKETKDTIARFFPSIDRVSLAKAIALGDKGAKELQAQVAGYEVLSAAERQGLGVSAINPGGVTESRAYQYALGGETFDTALTKFGTVAAALPTVNKLTEIYNQPAIGQVGLESAILGKSAEQIKAIEELSKREEASFSGRSGVSDISLASQRRGAGLI